MKNTFITLVIVVVVACGLRSFAQARSRPSCCGLLAVGDWTSPQIPKAPRPPAPPKQAGSPIRQGHGRTVLAWESLSSQYHTKEKEAYQDALAMARADLIAKLSEIKPGADFQPDLDVIERLVKSKEVIPETLEDNTDKITVVKVKLKLEMTQDQRDDLLRKVRLGEAWEAQLGLGKVMLGVLAILATAAGYFRLEDRTKGYCTGWLKFGAIALLALLGLACFAIS